MLLLPYKYGLHHYINIVTVVYKSGLHHYSYIMLLLSINLVYIITVTLLYCRSYVILELVHVGVTVDKCHTIYEIALQAPGPTCRHRGGQHAALSRTSMTSSTVTSADI